MTTGEVLTAVKGFLDAATSTHLKDAQTSKFDYPRTQRSDSIAIIRLIPLGGTDEGMHIGQGWYGQFNIRIEAKIPSAWDNTDHQLSLCDEIHQIVANNNAFLNNSGEQATLKSKVWHYGFESEGEAGERVIQVDVVYQGPQTTSA